MMPTNDIYSHRCWSERVSRAVLSLVVPRGSICSPTNFPTNLGVGRCSLDGMGVVGASLTCGRGLPTGGGPVNFPQHTVAPACAAVRGIPTRWGQELPLVLARARTSEAVKISTVFGTRSCLERL
jgi:hypothetical protein